MITKKTKPLWDSLPEPTDRRDWHLLACLVALITVTGRIEGERPESLLVVGPSGSGKTAILSRLLFGEDDPRNPHIMPLTNLSSMGLQEVLLTDVHKGTSHIVVPEMQTLMLRQRGVWDSLAGILLPALEEGVGVIRNHQKVVDFRGAKVGLVGAITTAAFDSNRGDMRESGLLQRMLTVRWDRLRENVLKSQLRWNAGDNSELEKIHIDLGGRVNVGITRQALDDVTHYAHQIEPGNPQRGARRLRALTKAVAYVNGDETATIHHAEALRQFARYWK